MKRHGLLVGLAAVALGLVGCGTNGSGPGGASTSPSGASGSSSLGVSPVTATGGAPSVEPTEVVEYRVTYGFAVPSTTVAINHTVPKPVAGANDPPLPWLVGIYVGDHPEGTPPYQRISFYFRGAFPSTKFNYVPSLVHDASGQPVTLPGNAILKIVFTDAQAHNNAGGSTITAQPSNPIGYNNLIGYAGAGDFEGHVTYGLGLHAAPNSDQVLRIRSGELRKPDGANGFFYVVHFDVQTA